MATEGKVPTLGFGAGAIGFVVLLGFSPAPPVAHSLTTWVRDGSSLSSGEGQRRDTFGTGAGVRNGASINASGGRRDGVFTDGTPVRRSTIGPGGGRRRG